MSQLNDVKFTALGNQGFVGDISDRWQQWLEDNGATSKTAIPDQEREVLAAQGFWVDPERSLNDAWFAFLGSLGYSQGSLNERWFAFFSDGGTLGPPPIPNWDTTPTPPPGDTGVLYQYDIGQHLNTRQGVSLATVAGALPDGLTYSGTQIVGVPTTVENQTGITTSATNASGADTSAPYSINITFGAVSWTSTPAPPDAVVNTPYSYDLTQHLNGTENVTVSVLQGSLPPGLSINNTTYVIEGTPTQAGSFNNIRLRATTPFNTDDTDPFDIAVDPEPPPIPNWTTDPPAVPDGQKDAFYSYDLSADLSTTEGVTVTVTGGALPDGLSIVRNTFIEGFPTTEETQSNIQLTATNASGSDQSLPFDFVITLQTPNWNTEPDPPDGQDGVPYSYDLGVLLNTTEGVTITSVGNPLPPGLSINNTTYLLEGTPTTLGSYTGLQFDATNSGGTDVSDVSSIIILPITPLWLTTPNPPDGITDTPYGPYDLAQHLNTTEGVTITSTGSPLPPGLSINNTTWELEGIPTTQGTYSNIQLTATNVSGSDETLPFDIVVTLKDTVDIRLDDPVQNLKEVLDRGLESFTAAGSVGTAVQVRETPEQIAITVPLSGLAETYAALVRYTIDGANNWADAHPLYRAIPAQIGDAFSGAIFGLQPGQTYDIEITYTNGVDTFVRTKADHGTFTTRALPADVSAQTPDASPTSLAALQSAVDAASPGDVIELQDATYPMTSQITVSVSGTPGNPIVIRGASLANTVINRTSQGRVFAINADHIVLENMTIDANYPPDTESTGAGDDAILLGSTNPVNDVEYITIRDMTILNAPLGIKAAGGSSGILNNFCLVYNCTLHGTLDWAAEHLLGTGNPGNRWNNDGIRLPGHGNCIFNNRIDDFSDSITFAHSTDENPNDIECNYAYRNYIRNSNNDAFELDHAERFIGVYDNYCENNQTCFSQSDNVTIRHIGPSYVFRNAFVNIAVRGFKPNAVGIGGSAGWQGWHWYNNSFVRVKGVPGSTYEASGYDTSGGTRNNRFAIRNNIFISRNNSGDLWTPRFTDGRDAPHYIDTTHNAWYQTDKRVRWPDSGPTFANAAAAIAGTPTSGIDSHQVLYPAVSGLVTSMRYNEFDVISESDPFADGLALGPDAGTEITGQPSLAISPTSNLKNAGTPIPNITDGFIGGAPDIGANIEGRPDVAYGPSAAPTWLAAAPTREWFAVPTINTAADIGGNYAGVTAYTGGGFDQGRLEFVKTCSGGHTVYWQNPTFVLQLNREQPRWVMLVNSSLITDRDDGFGNNAANADTTYHNAYQADGTPRSLHNWNQAWWPVGDNIWLPAMTGCYRNAGISSHVWSLNRAALSDSAPIENIDAPWTYHDQGIPATYGGLGSGHRFEGGIAAFDEDTGLIWVAGQFSNTGQYPFYSIDTANGQVNQFPSFGGRFPVTGSAGFLRGSSFIADGHWIMVQGNGATGAFVMNLSNPTAANTKQIVNLVGSPNGSQLDICGVAYHAPTRTAYFYKPGNGKTFITLTVPSDPWNGTYTWGTETPSGPTPSGLSGNYSHFVYVKDIGNGQSALLHGGGYTSAPWMYKL